MTDMDETAEPVETVAERQLPDNEMIRDLVGPFATAEVGERQYASSEVTYFTIAISVEDWVRFAEAAKDSGFDTFSDLFAVDHFSEAPRFEIILNLVAMDANERIVISTRIPYDDPMLPTLTPVFVGANFYEREAFDLFGIVFDGHPDLTRILLPDDWEGFPLRKDYDIGSVPVQFKEGSSNL